MVSAGGQCESRPAGRASGGRDVVHGLAYRHSRVARGTARDVRSSLDGTLAPNLEMADVEMVWVEGDSTLGALHIAAHGVTKDEVEVVLLEIPPEVEAKRHPDPMAILPFSCSNSRVCPLKIVLLPIET